MKYYPPPTPEQKQKMDEETRQINERYMLVQGLIKRIDNNTLTEQDKLDVIKYSDDILKWRQYDTRMNSIKQFEQACADRSAARLKDPNWDRQRGNLKNGS